MWVRCRCESKGRCALGVDVSGENMCELGVGVSVRKV